MKRVIAMSLLTSIAFTTACQTTGPKEQTGALMGALAGAAAGSQVGDGDGTIAAILVGAVLGALAGGAIGAELDEADKIKAQQAAALAANAVSGKRSTWKSEKNTGVHGYAEPASPVTSRDGALCKNIRNVYYINNEEKEQISTFCLRNGRWVDA
jgi:surface antigen